MVHFADRLMEAVEKKRSCVVVGLDPRPERLPEEFGLPSAGRKRGEESIDPARAAEAVLEFNRQVIEAVAPAAVAVKPQVAFYERLGWRGMRAYAETISAAREAGLLVIADVKRGDIGSTAEAYAAAHFEAFGADAVTLNPYLGYDSVEPFTRYCARGRGAFVLVKTSNPSSDELQDWPGAASGGAKEGGRLWERVAELVGRWSEPLRGESGYSSMGAVVGATFGGVAAELRRMLPHAPFLVPGYGAQGADAEACAPCFNPDGLGAVVNSSRGIILAYERSPWRERFGPADWRAAIQAAAVDMRDALEAVRRR